MIGTYADYQLAAKDIDRTIERVRKEPLVARETEYYQETIGSIKSIDAFFEDDRIYSYAMKAMGMSEMTYAKGLMRKLLEEGRDEPEALANRLSDPRYKKFAETFDFKRYDRATTSFNRATVDVVNSYLRQTLEENEGNKNEAVRLALYFERKAPELGSTMEILADKAIYQVVRTVLGIPDAIAASDIDKQVELIEKKLDFEELKDPDFLKKTIEQFAARWDVDNPPASFSSTGLLFGGGGGLSQDLLLAVLRVG